VFRFPLGLDDTVVVLVDGHPVADLAVDASVLDDAARERHGRPTVVERYVVVHAMNAEQFRDLPRALGLPESWFGRFKPGPDGRSDISLDAGELSCGSVIGLHLAIAYAESVGLAYDETSTTHHPAARPAP
jgi:hypothetical protein